VPVKLYLTSAAGGPVTVHLSSLGSSTATNGNDYTISSNSATFPAGTTGPQTINVTIKDDNSYEGNEYINLGYAITAGGGFATAGNTLQNYEIEIDDDEVAANSGLINTVSTGPGLDDLGPSSPLQGTQTDKKSQYLYLASELLADGLRPGVITDISFIINTKASSAPFKGFTFKVGATSVSNLSNGFATPTSWKTITSGNYDTRFGNNDFTIPGGFLWNGTSNLLFEFCYNNTAASSDDILEGDGTSYTCQARKSSTVAADDGCSYPTATLNSTYRPLFNFTQTSPQTIISSQLNSTSQAAFSSGDKIFFFDGSGNIIASIQNGNSYDYGCTSITIDRAGTGASQFVYSGFANYLMNKTFRVIPGTYHPDGVYTITLYYTAAEKAGWETATLNSWNNIQLIKTSGPISAATPSNPGASGAIEMVTPTRSMFGSDYTLSYTFSDGFSGFGAGIISGTLPVSLLKFEGAKQHAGVELKWTTEQEINTNHFEVQRSANGLNFETIGIVKSFGLTGGNIYSMQDTRAGSVNYYRLKVVDNDGNYTFSTIIAINIAGLRQRIYVLNNPFSNIIRLGFTNQPGERVTTRLMDGSGKLLQQNEFKHVVNSIEFNAPSYLSKGIYLLEAVVDGTRFTYKLVKE
ncbi:MAG: Calx-beta domain-containing protein, partial [Bacteroidota bacterium]